jgi:dihydrofolate reductase
VLIPSSVNVFSAEHRQLPSAGSLIVAHEIRIAVCALQLEVPVIGRQPRVDHLRDHDATASKNQCAWRLLAAVACVALDTDAEEPFFRHLRSPYDVDTSHIEQLDTTPASRKIASERIVSRQPARRTEMGKIVVSDNVSLDGVIQDPAGDEGFRLGGWVGLIKDRQGINKLTLDEALGTQALLLGRRSYEWFAARWPSRSGELADRINSLPKYVVSSTLENPDWKNSTVLKGDVVNEVSRLKHKIDGEIVVWASFQLVRTLMEHDLIDELRLKIYPVVLGAGERLFGKTSDKKPMRLVSTQTVDGDVAFLTYERVRDA